MFGTLYERLEKRRSRWDNEEEVRIGWVSELETATGIQMQAERQRRDSSYNNVVIEFKDKGKFKGKVSTPAFQEAMSHRLEPYIKRTAKAEHRDASDYIGIAIDGDHISFAQVIGERIAHGPLLPFSRTSVAMVALACKGAFRRFITADNLTEDFGHLSECGRDLMTALAGALETYANEVGANKVKMLFEEWRSLFGQVADLTTAQAQAVQNGMPFKIASKADLKIPLSLFVIHTYNSLIIKLLSAEIVSAHGLTSHKFFAQKLATASDDEILESLTSEIEGGGFYSSAGIDGFVQEALFSWYLDACKPPNRGGGIIKAIRGVLASLSLYRSDKLTVARSSDLLKRFYQDLVPEVLRKSLGEFYTPDWLVNFTLDKAAVTDWLEARLLDPACGSGSFLLVAIERKRKAALAAGLSDGATVAKISQTVWGFDLNPLAVLATRVNYLIAIADLLKPGQRIELPVLLADAIYSPTHDQDNDEDVVDYQIGSASANLKITMPTPLATNRQRLDKVMEIMAETVADDEEYDRVAKVLIRSKAITEDEERRWRKPLSATYKGVLSLHRKQWNGIWFRIVRNFFWSATAGEFDIIAGNPPWVRWSKLPDLYRNRVKPTCERYDIFSSTPHHGGNELDVSGIITYAAADKWLKDGGTLAFVITQTHFQSPSSEGFRNFRINDEDNLIPLSVDDMKAVRPFPGVANKTAVAIFEKTKGGRPTYPIDYTVWTKQPGSSANIPVTLKLSEAMRQIQPKSMHANPVGGDGSPWAILPPGRFKFVKRIAGSSSWVNGRKGITADLNGVFFVEVLDWNASNNLVQISSRPDAGKHKIGVAKKFWVEPDLLYPLIKGASDFSACRLHREHNLFAFVPNRGIRQQDYEAAEESMDELPKTKRYFADYAKFLRGRSTYRTRQKNAPYYSIYNVGAYTFAPWKVIWAEQGDFGAAVVGEAEGPTGEVRPFVPDHKVFFADFDDRETAFYLCGLLSSELAKEFVESHNISIQVGDIFKHMSLPEFDPDNGEHAELSIAASRAHDAATDAEYESHMEDVRRLGESILSKL